MNQAPTKCAQRAAVDAEDAPSDPDLQRVIDAWSSLPEKVRARILATVGAVRPTSKESDTSKRLAVLVEMYRLSSQARIYRAPREYFFWLLTTRLHMDAHVGPEAVVHQKEHLGPLWDRLEAIQKKHGWPDKDENGDPWNPHDHLDQVPEVLCGLGSRVRPSR